ncbi:MAG: hypothetical protein ACK5DE_03610 [Bacteroidota bacterium]|jgi:hypothetical protein
MKQSIQFNHEANSFTEAIGVKLSQHEFAEILANISGEFFSEKSGKISHLSEMLHDKLTYECILFLATCEVYNRIAEIVEIADESAPSVGMLKRVIDAIKNHKSDINMN